jgi:hypothetical protein
VGLVRGLLIALLVTAITLAMSARPAAAQRPGVGLHSCGELAVKFRSHTVIAYAGRTRCRTARRIGRAWVARGGCGTCRVKRWACRSVPTDSGSFPRCVRGRHPRRVVELDVIIRGA